MATTGSPQILDSAMITFINEIMDSWKIVGLSMCVVRQDGEVEYGGFGTMDDEGRPVTPDTLFGIASCSKAFCGFALSQVMEDYESGRIDKPLPSGLKSFEWTTPVQKVLPGLWKLQDKHATEVAAPIDLVAHVTGLAGHDLCYTPEDTAETVLSERLPHLVPNRGLREEYQYNNMMYMAAQTIVAKLSGKPYTEFIKERIFDPVGMTSSSFDVEKAFATQNFARGFTFTGPNKDIKRFEPHFIQANASVDLMAGAGGIVSNVRDMSKWLKTLLAKGVVPGSDVPLVTEQHFKYQTAGHYVREVNGSPFPETSAQTYGAGWFQYSLQGHQLVCHTGGTPGISAYTIFLPDDKLGFSLLCNTGNRQMALLSIVHRIVETVLDLKRIDWSARFKEMSAKQEQQQKEKAPPRLADAAPPPLDLAAYCGTYKNPGYGSFTLHGPGSRSSDKGDKVISDFAAVNGSPSAPFPDEAHTTPQLYAEFTRIWGSHLRLHHREGNVWNATVEMLYPEGYGKDKTPFTRPGAGPFGVEFIMESEKVGGLNILENTLYAAQVQQSADNDKKIWFERTS